MKRCLASLTIAVLAPCLMAAITAGVWGNDRATTVNRVGSDVRYLASDELEGRGPGTDGLEKAAQYIRATFENLGLRGAGNDGAYLRPFEISLGAEVVEAETSAVLRGPSGRVIELQLGQQYQPLSTRTTEPLEAELVFAGYGISAAKIGYDDYEGRDVKGKAVVVIRREPQQDDEASKFEGKRTSSHSYIRSKIKAAEEAGAALLLLVNDPFTTSKEQSDQLSRPGGFGRRTGKIPFVHVKQDVVEGILEQSPIREDGQSLTRLADIEAAIDESLDPLTQPLAGWEIELKCTFETTNDDVTNVAAVIPGQGPLADETIVIGAHYDHLGFGPYGSRRPAAREVHNGADDNATGTAAVMELARRFATRPDKPARRLVFIAFTAEERGLLGSKHYLDNPLFPLDKTVAMVNFDMIGHLKDAGLVVGGVASAKEFPSIVERLSDGISFEIKTPGTTGGSDHAGFYRNDIPFLFFHTGITDIYHTPDDDFETIDVEGTVATIDFAERVLDELIKMPERPQFTKIQSPRRSRRANAYLGIVPDYGDQQEQDGVRCAQVNPGSPAAKGDLRQDDVILKLGDVDIADVSALTEALRKYKAGQEVEVVVRRGEGEETLKVTLGSPGG